MQGTYCRSAFFIHWKKKKMEKRREGRGEEEEEKTLTVYQVTSTYLSHSETHTTLTHTFIHALRFVGHFDH